MKSDTHYIILNIWVAASLVMQEPVMLIAALWPFYLFVVKSVEEYRATGNYPF